MTETRRGFLRFIGLAPIGVPAALTFAVSLPISAADRARQYMDMIKVGLRSPNEVRALEQRAFHIDKICRAFSVPPSEIRS